jgi:hypothetical protein
MYGQGLDVLAHLVPRSMDTLETLMQMQAHLDLATPEGSSGARVFAAPNLHKLPGGGMSGTVVELDEQLPAMHLETVTHNVFEGVCIVRCEDTQAVARRVQDDPDGLRRCLADFNAAQRAAKPKQPSLEQVLPQPGAHTDFWWHGQCAHLKASENTYLNTAGGAQDGTLYYYDMMDSRPESVDAGSADVNLRDGAVWHACLTGYVVLLEQVGGGDRGFYLACRAALPAFASELVTSWKSDVGAHISVGDFVESKEVWWLRTMNTRNRQRLLAQAAQCLGIHIQTTPDPLTHASAQAYALAAITAEVLIEDVQCLSVHDPTQNECMPRGSVERKAATANVVRHFVGCVDAQAARGPLLLDLGAQQGLAVLLPPGVPLESVEARDKSAFPHLETRELVPLPVVNVHDSSSVHTAIAQRNVHDLPRLEPRDIVFGAEHTNTRLPRRIERLCAGELALRAAQYPQQLPTVLYPSTCATMVPVDHPAPLFEAARDDVQLSPRNRKAFATTALHVLFEDFGVSVRAKPAAPRQAASTEAARVCIHMDDNMLELAVALAAPGHPMPRLVRLVPRCLPAGL